MASIQGQNPHQKQQKVQSNHKKKGKKGKASAKQVPA